MVFMKDLSLGFFRVFIYFKMFIYSNIVPDYFRKAVMADLTALGLDDNGDPIQEGQA